MSAITKKSGSEITAGFLWRDRKGISHPVGKMETRHLFYTLRMIWNHTMPDDAKLEPYRRYSFGPEYTDNYMKTAIVMIYRELSRRPNIAESWKSDLRWMQEYFIRRLDEKVQYISHTESSNSSSFR